MKYKINYKDVLKSVVQGIVLINLEGCLVDVNKAFADLLGYKKNELIGKYLVDISPFSLPEIPDEDSFPIKNPPVNIPLIKIPTIKIKITFL